MHTVARLQSRERSARPLSRLVSALHTPLAARISAPRTRQSCNLPTRTVIPPLVAAAFDRLAARVSKWPRSARHATTQALLTAAVLWSALIGMWALGGGNRSVAGPIKGADFLQFYSSGFLVRTHQTEKLYDIRALHETQVALVPESDPELYPPVYPPQMGLIFAPFSALSYRAALLLWTLVTISIYAVVVYAAWRRVRESVPDSALVAAAAACFPGLWSVVLDGQLTMLVVLAFWLAASALERDWKFVAGGAFGLLLLKPQFGLVIAAVALALGEWRIIAGAAASVGLQAAVILLVLGRRVVDAYASFVPVALRYADLLEPKPYQSHSLRALTRLAPSWLAVPLWMCASAAVIVVAIKVWRVSTHWRLRTSILILASVLVNPHLIVYDSAVLAFPLLWIGAYLTEAGAGSVPRAYWTLVYWLFVTLLAPTAAAVPLQVSVLLMIWILYVAAKAAHEAGAPPAQPVLLPAA